MIVKSRVSLLFLVASLGVGGPSCADMKDADPCYRFARVYCEKTELDEGDCRDVTHNTCNDVIRETDDAEPWDECTESLAEESECVDLRGLKSACPELPASLLVSRCGLDGGGSGGSGGGSGAKGGTGGSGGSSARGGTGGGGSSGKGGAGGTSGKGGASSTGGSAGKGGADGAGGSAGAAARGGIGGTAGSGAASGRGGFGGSGGLVSPQGGLSGTSPFAGRGGTSGEAGDTGVGDACATLYLDPYLEGPSLHMDPNVEFYELPETFNDGVSSVEVAEYCQLYLYFDPDFDGGAIPLEGTYDTLGPFDNQASSAICECSSGSRL
jgi:hypothetical protein